MVLGDAQLFYFNKRESLLSARGLPPVWHVAQY